MEGDDGEQSSVSESSCTSPIVTRPKLPPFAGSGSRPASPQQKTELGRGEIKAIMEDIMNLKKTDWKTFSRSRTATLPRGKSVSSHSSPCTSPRIGSPSRKDSKSGLSRDRSRSLKLLTDRLMNRSSKQAAVDKPESSDESECRDMVVVSKTIFLEPVRDTCEQGAPHSVMGTCSKRSPEKQTVEHAYEQIPESPEDAEQEDVEGTKSVSSDESFRTVPDSVLDESVVTHEKSSESDFPRGSFEESSDGDGDRSRRSQEMYVNVKPTTEKTADDEGLGEGGEHSAPFISTYIYHPIPRNSKFLQLAATKPPKRFPPERRSGIAMLAGRGIVGGVSKTRSDDFGSQLADLHPRQRHQRRSDSSLQKSSPRFITHPPQRKVSHEETGSVDTNGFAALRSPAASEDEEKNSQVSLVDSQFASDMSDDVSYQNVVEGLVTDTCIDISEGKNGKSVKQKSKSDPSGDRVHDVHDFPQSMESPQSQSAPLLSEEEVSEKSLMFFQEEKQDSCSENTVSSQYILGDEDHSSAGENDDHGSGEFRNFDISSPDHEVIISPPSAPMTPRGPSPVSAPEQPTNLLSVPVALGTGRKPNIFRSASSASVLQSRKSVGSPAREKDVVRKYSITSDESITNSKSSANLAPDFLPIGDTGNASSMPTVWNRDRFSTDSPEREPGFVKVKKTKPIQL